MITTLETESFTRGLFDRDVTNLLESGGDIETMLPINRILIATVDGGMNGPAWCLPSDPRFHSSNEIKPIHFQPKKDGVFITSMKISLNHKFLYAGTSNGAVRIYSYPPDSDEDRYIEFAMHQSSVVDIRESCDSKNVISIGEDGSIFVFKVSLKDITKPGAADASLSTTLQEIVPDESKAKVVTIANRYEVGSTLMGYGEEDVAKLNKDVVMMSNDEMEEHINEIVELQKKVADLQSKFTFEIRNMEFAHSEEQRKITEAHDKGLNDEKDKYDSLQRDFDTRVKELLNLQSAKDSEHVKVLSEIENQYEHKLANQIDRFDKLSEDMELLKQRCEGLLIMERKDAEKQINDLKIEARNREKRMKSENKRVKDEKSADEGAFKEILEQQEDEYEDELRQLIGAAESELTSERETIVKLRTLVQTKNTKLDQMKKKLIEVTQASKARLVLLQNEKKERIKLQDTIDHYKKNLQEREQALAEKETVLLDLRNTTRTLENFRFVLDNRLQQLSAERGPITTHIEDLENHISTMYEELVAEFEAKKVAVGQMELKDNKLQFAQAESNRLHADQRAKELYISGFKRELGNIVTATMVGKDLEDAVRNLYKKYVKGEQVSVKSATAGEEVTNAVAALIEDDDSSITTSPGKGKHGGHSIKDLKAEVEIELIETAKEADRQKTFVERSAKNLLHRLKQERGDSMRQGARRLMENSTLMYECNDLRIDKKNLERKIFLLEDRIKVLERDAIHKSGGEKFGPAGNERAGIDDTSQVGSLGEMSSLEGSVQQQIAGAQKRAGTGEVGGGAGKGDLKDGSVSIPDPHYEHLDEVLSAALKAAKDTKSAPLLDVLSVRSTTPKGVVAVSATANIRSSVSGPGPQRVVPLQMAQSAPLLKQSHQGGLRPRMPPSPMVETGSKPSHKGKTAREVLVVQRMATEVEQLMEQLDMAHREREMQRAELARVRAQLVRVAGIQPPSQSKIASILENTFSPAVLQKKVVGGAIGEKSVDTGDLKGLSLAMSSVDSVNMSQKSVNDSPSRELERAKRASERSELLD